MWEHLPTAWKIGQVIMGQIEISELKCLGRYLDDYLIFVSFGFGSFNLIRAYLTVKNLREPEPHGKIKSFKPGDEKKKAE